MNSRIILLTSISIGLAGSWCPIEQVFGIFFPNKLFRDKSLDIPQYGAVAVQWGQ